MARRKKECLAGHEGCNCTMMCCSFQPERGIAIAREAKESHPGQWARELNYGPACVCGMRGDPYCYRHQKRGK